MKGAQAEVLVILVAILTACGTPPPVPGWVIAEDTPGLITVFTDEKRFDLIFAALELARATGGNHDDYETSKNLTVEVVLKRSAACRIPSGTRVLKLRDGPTVKGVRTINVAVLDDPHKGCKGLLPTRRFVPEKR